MVNKIFSLAHVERMTDSIGMLEHCVLSKPDHNEGYSTDDNARALQVILRLNKSSSDAHLQKYSSIYLQFLLSASSPLGFHQDLNADLTWKNDAGVGEGFGRAMAALGEAAITAPITDERAAAISMFDRQASLIKKVKYIRVMAQLIPALSHRIQFKTTLPKLVTLLRSKLVHLADGLAASYASHSTRSWNWYEDVLSYDNGRLPLGVLYAYRVSGDKKYLKIALKSLDFLLAQTYDTTKDCFSFPGNQGWFVKDGKKALFAQQPIEAGSTVEACAFAYEITHKKEYLDYAFKALEWYKGKNILGMNMIDKSTGGVKDGLEEWGVNHNEGAESILSYALACLALKKATS